MRTILAMTILVLPIAASAETTTAPTVSLGVRYTDALHGFSLCPPLRTERIRQTSPRRLVGWVRRDEKTGAIRWTLEVLRTKHKPSKLLLSQYAEAVAGELAKTNNFKVKSTRIAVVAGKPAMHFRGFWTGAFKLWRRQTWVRTRPNEHLVLDIAGLVSDTDEMDAVLTAVAGSLVLLDTKTVISERRKNLQRGSAVMDGLALPDLMPILAGQSRYYKVQLDGKTIGFLKITESTAKRSGTRGLRVVRCGALKIPDQPRRLTYEELFATDDRKVEYWRFTAVDGEGTSAVRSVQEGIKQDNLVLMHTSRPGQARQTHQRKVPPAIRSAYLPQALGTVVVRLIDRSKPAAYGFAIYNAKANDFDLRIISIIGPKTITLAGKRTAATHLTDQMAADEPPANLWVDEKGFLLRMRAAGGLTIERTNRKSVIAAFADELIELEKLGKP